MNPIQKNRQLSQQRQFLPVLATERYGSGLRAFYDYDFLKLVAYMGDEIKCVQKALFNILKADRAEVESHLSVAF